MMNCSEIQKKILQSPQGILRDHPESRHVAQCLDCQSLALQLQQLENDVRRLPVPDSTAAKHSLQELVLTGLAAPAAGQRVWQQMKRYSVTVVAGLAASFLVVFSFYSLPNQQRSQAQAGPRHELLKQEVDHLVALARADSPNQKLMIWSKWVVDIEQESAEVYKIASPEDMNRLARMYHQAMKEGMLLEAKKLPKYSNRQQRHELITGLILKLEQSSRHTKNLADTAPPGSKSSLQRMALSAQQTQAELLQIAEGI